MDTVTSADGTKIAFERTGSGPPLVLVHGQVDIHSFWEMKGVRPAFAEHFTVYSLDRRGHGASADAPEYHLEREAEDVAAVVDATDGPAVLLGHSGGAIYALEAALRTTNLRKLILNQPPMRVGDHEPYPEEIDNELKKLLEVGKNEEALIFFLQEVAQDTPEEIETVRSKPFWKDMMKAAYTLPRESEAIAGYTFDTAQFETLYLPTLLLTASDTHPLFQDAIDMLHKSLPVSRVFSFEGHGHEVMITAPEQFVKEVVAFINE